MEGRVISYRFIIVVFVLFSISTQGFAIPTDSLKRFKIGVLPSAFYTPETKIGFGALVYTYFKVGKNDSLLKKSNTQTYVSYTLNEQTAIENDYQLWLFKNKLYHTGVIDYSRFPQFYYGIGTVNKNTDKQSIDLEIVKVNSKNLFQVHKNIYSGIQFQYYTVFHQNKHMLSGNDDRVVYGDMGFKSVGIGPIIIIDKRDNPLNPSNGSYFEASYLDYGKVIYNKNRFSSLTIDARKFKTLPNKIIWNINAYGSFNNGDVPYKLMAEIGGARFLRGYYKGRFRDNNMIIIQQEFRMPIYKAFGIAAFGGLGSVAKTLADFRKNEVHYNYGVGLRIRVNKKENTNIRIDYGFTKDSQGLYIVFAEAF